MRVERLVLGRLDTNCFLVGDDADGPLVVIDPAGDAETLIAAVAEREVAMIVLTHAHVDHLGAADALRVLTGAPLLVHAADAAAVSDADANLATFLGERTVTATPERVLEDGELLAAGTLELEVIHTPGHTPGCICLYGGGHLFSGDTLFANSVGRTDLPGGDGRALSRSIGERLSPLPAETVVHPGHGPDTTIGREQRLNPFFPRA